MVALALLLNNKQQQPSTQLQAASTCLSRQAGSREAYQTHFLANIVDVQVYMPTAATSKPFGHSSKLQQLQHTAALTMAKIALLPPM
jgi:hypothetical protein